MSVYVAFICDHDEEKYVDYTQAFKDKEACRKVAIKLCEELKELAESDDDCRFQYDIRELEVY